MALEKRLWNGEYYVHDVDLEEHLEYGWGAGCHSDQLFGQWWAHCLGLGHVIEPGRVRTAALSIFRYNFREGFRAHDQRPRPFATAADSGLLNCTWPRGGRPPAPIFYTDEVWTGIEYELAALLLYEDEVEPALRIIEAARARYDGHKQSPWNDIECGDHYVRAMSSWALLEAASGYQYEAGSAHIRFAPVFTPEDYRAPFVAREGWGTFTQRVADGSQVETIIPIYGSLTLRTMQFRASIDVSSATVTAGDRPVGAALSCTEGDVMITLATPVTLRAGQRLEVNLSRASHFRPGVS
jgi:hypothetical protein